MNNNDKCFGHINMPIILVCELKCDRARKYRPVWFQSHKNRCTDTQRDAAGVRGRVPHDDPGQPVDQAGESSTRQIEGTEPGRSSTPALVIYMNILHTQKEPVSAKSSADTGLLPNVQQYCQFNVCTGTAAPCLGTSLRK